MSADFLGTGTSRPTTLRIASTRASARGPRTGTDLRRPLEITTGTRLNRRARRLAEGALLPRRFHARKRPWLEDRRLRALDPRCQAWRRTLAIEPLHRDRPLALDSRTKPVVPARTALFRLRQDDSRTTGNGGAPLGSDARIRTIEVAPSGPLPFDLDLRPLRPDLPWENFAPVEARISRTGGIPHGSLRTNRAGIRITPDGAQTAQRFWTHRRFADIGPARTGPLLRHIHERDRARGNAAGTPSRRIAGASAPVLARRPRVDRHRNRLNRRGEPRLPRNDRLLGTQSTARAGTALVAHESAEDRRGGNGNGDRTTRRDRSNGLVERARRTGAHGNRNGHRDRQDARHDR